MWYDFPNGVVTALFPNSKLPSVRKNMRFQAVRKCIITYAAGTSPCANYSQGVVNRVLQGNTEHSLPKYIFIGHLKELGAPLDVSVRTAGSGSPNDRH